MAKQLVDASQVSVLETELVQQGKLAFKTAQNGLQVRQIFSSYCCTPFPSMTMNMSRHMSVLQMAKFNMEEERGTIRITEADEGIVRYCMWYNIIYI